MKISRKWLKEYTTINLSDQELADRLSDTGTAVEEIITGLNDKIIVAQITEIKKHPNADRLQIALVNTGLETLQIVCGAPNIAVGQKVPLAQIGAILPAFEIKKSDIRGVESFGMLCAPDELGIGQDHEGIMILEAECEISKPLSDYIGNDTLFEIEVTPNRGDLLSHIGVAREISAFSGSNKVKKEPISLPMSSERAADLLKVSINDTKLCSQYMARVVKNVKIGPSPKWLADKITAMGSKPINNVVDATNYIMFDLGQPLHAFDMDKVGKKEIIVRRAQEKESLKTLDGVERILDKNTLVIADATKPIAIAGVMGGANSEVEMKTANIVLESAEFDRVSVRRTSKKQGIASEASYRFERGIDSGNVEYALNKAAKLIAEIAGGSVLNGIVQAGTRPVNEIITVDYTKIDRLLGLNLSESEINHILNGLGFEIKSGTATIPLWRKDIKIWQDLAEEVGRIYGYNKIKPIPIEKTALAKRSDYYKVEKLKDLLVCAGFSEVYNYPFLSLADIETAKLKSSELVEVANPIQTENKFLRSSAIPGLLRNVAKNPTFDPVLLFETGKVFNKKEEILSLAVVASGKKAEKLINDCAEVVASFLKMKKGSIKIIESSREELQRFKIKKPVTFAFEIDLSSILPSLKIADAALGLTLSKKKVIYRPMSKYPSVTRDLAFILNKSVDADEVEDAIRALSDNISRVELFDEFISDTLGKNMKNIAFHLYLQEMNRTMTDESANMIINKVIKEIETKYSAKLRTAKE